MRTVILAGLMAFGAPASAQAMDYAKAGSWLCRPDANGPCDTDLSLTEISAAGARVMPPPPAAKAAVDCFYVYPTVSRQAAGNADGRATEEEIYVVQQQFARFGEVCRRFAPLYRQTTLATIGGAVKGDGALAYADVKASWERYLQADNGGRGVILIGHSQGARHLRQLIAEEIAGKPVEKQIVAAHVIGFPVAVPDGAVAPPALKPCAAATDVGCMVAYVTFHAPSPPAPDNRFAGRPGEGLRVACVNPGALLGSPTVTAIMPTQSRMQPGGQAAPSFADAGVTTASVALAGLVKAACVRTDGTDYLAVSSPVARVDAGFARIDAALPGWGLHLVDMNVALGSLIALAKAQGAAWIRLNGGSAAAR